MRHLKLILSALALSTVSMAAIPTAAAAQDDSYQVPMFCALRAMGSGDMRYFMTGVFYGDYNNNLKYQNRFSAWVNANYEGLGGQYATYCFYGDDEDAAYQKMNNMISAERSGGSYVITTNWGG